MNQQRTPSIPMSSPDLTNAEREAVAAVLRTPNLSMGHEIQGFEQAMCTYTGSQNAIGVNSGTAGLHLCVRAAGIGENDVVITTPFSFVASANVLLFERAIPVFVDVDPVTGNIDPQQVRAAAADLAAGVTAARIWLPPRGASQIAALKAILPVDVFGQPAEMDAINEVAATYHLKVIEDACEALGAEYKGRKAGLLGDYGVFAFYPNKQITTGEGGCIITHDDEAANFMRALRNQGRAPGDTWLQHTYLGYNYRLDEMSAAIGRVQMNRLDELLASRQAVANWYHAGLASIAGVEAPIVVPSTTRVSWFVYVVRFDPAINREQVVKQLAKLGVPARPYFAPIHLQPFMIERFGYQEGMFPVTEDLGRRGLALPFSGVMTQEQVEYVCEALRQVLRA
ncbi:MAG: DegT/DnrJ/EryC1/StrS family aminotransferase [Chloroflexota bacterium]